MSRVLSKPISIAILLAVSLVNLNGCVASTDRSEHSSLSVSIQETQLNAKEEHVIFETRSYLLPRGFDLDEKINLNKTVSVIGSLAPNKLLLLDSEGMDLFSFTIDSKQLDKFEQVSSNAIILDAITYDDWIVWLEQERGDSASFSGDLGWRIMRSRISGGETQTVAEFTGMAGDPVLIGLGKALLPSSLTLTADGSVAAVIQIVPAYLEKYSFTVLASESNRLTEASDLAAAVILFRELEGDDQAYMAENILDRLDNQKGRTFGSLQYNQGRLIWLWMPIPDTLQRAETDSASSSQLDANLLKLYDLNSSEVESLQLPGPALSAAWVEGRLLLIPLVSERIVADDNWVSGTVLEYDAERGQFIWAAYLEEILSASIERLPSVPQLPPYRILTADHYLTFTSLAQLTLVDMRNKISYQMEFDTDRAIHNPVIINLSSDSLIIRYQEVIEDEILTRVILTPLP